MIKLITGAMGSGKSAELLKEILRNDEKQNLIVKPEMDTRTPGVIKSRNGMYVPAFEVVGFYKILKMLEKIDDIEVIFIDELQFLETFMLREFIIYCQKNNIDVIASGLDLTSELTPFETVARFSCYADEVVKIKGKCQKCSKEKTSSLSEYQGENKGDIKIGNEEYIGVCPNCHKLIGGKINE